MNYTIYDKDGNRVNCIFADESFVIDYCERNSYTFEESPLPEPEPDYEPTETERLRADLDYLAALTGVEL